MFDKFGYYFASGVKSYSKFECMQNGRTTFHFNDEVFSAINTKVEPNETLPELYRDRARQIRDAYDYVVLMYSGGSDSDTVLNSFVSIGCKIDEIATTWDYPTTGLAQSFHNAEVTNVVLPKIKELKDKGLDFNFRTIDITKLGLNTFKSFGTNFEYYVNHHMSPNNMAKHFLRDHIKEWQDIIATGKKLVLVWGSEKPVLHVENDKWYFRFADRLDNCIGPYTFKPGWYDEMFFWTPDMPEIVVKQAHTVKKFCSTYNDQAWMWQDTPNDSGYNKTLDKYLTYAGLKCVIYPAWDPHTFCNGKGSSMIYSERDNFFFEGNVYVDRFNDIVDSLFRQTHNKTPRKNRFAIHAMYTKRYEI
ncbi:MAG: hypothetical protein ACXV2C_01715 [Candidatus Bathyarchaeia archaeon]